MLTRWLRAVTLLKDYFFIYVFGKHIFTNTFFNVDNTIIHYLLANVEVFDRFLFNVFYY